MRTKLPPPPACRELSANRRSRGAPIIARGSVLSHRASMLPEFQADLKTAECGGQIQSFHDCGVTRERPAT